jgi:hypothetical protein
VLTRPALLAFAVILGCGDAARLDELERVSIEQQARRLRIEDDWRPLTEVEKIHALLDAVDASDATFLLGRRSWDGARTRDFLRRRYVRASSRITTAEQFIVGVASRQRVTNLPYEVQLAAGQRMELRAWLREELDRIERDEHDRHQTALHARTPPTPDSSPRTDLPSTAGGGGDGAVAIETDEITRLPEAFEDPISHERVVPNTIGYVLALVRHSNATFIAPRTPPRRGRLPADATRYDGGDFSTMLQRKTKWIGAGIHELDPWLAAIGARSYRYDVAYQVMRPDGRIEAFDAWVEARRHGPHGAAAAPAVEPPAPAGQAGPAGPPGGDTTGRAAPDREHAGGP